MVNGSAESRYGVVVPIIGRQLILERCIHCVAKQFQSRIRPKGNSALHNQPLLVVSVLDGDTFEVLHNTRAERIRLNGIDCPEKGQAYGKRAKQAASELVFRKEVTLRTHGKDKYGRTIADVLLPDGTNVNHTLVKDGWCWWYRKHGPGDTVLEGLEKDAREAKKGHQQAAARAAQIEAELGQSHKKSDTSVRALAH